MNLIWKFRDYKLNYMVNSLTRDSFLVIFVVVCFTGCRTPVFEPIDVTKIPDGEYEGESIKFPGPMIVHTIIKDGKICEIKLLKHFALKKYTNMMQPLITNIIAKQDVNVDAVTGATISSTALKRAVHDSLKKAIKQSAMTNSNEASGNKK